MDNPYQPPLSALAHRGNVHALFLPTQRELIFLGSLTLVSLLSHRWHDEIHGFLNVHSAVSGFVLEALLLGAVGCWLVTQRNRLPVAKFLLGVTVGAAVALTVALACCWTLLFAGQPPHAFILPVSVLAGMLITAFMSGAISEQATLEHGTLEHGTLAAHDKT